MSELKGQVAVITGSTSGIGEATARKLFQNGAKLVLTGRQTEKLSVLASELEATFLAGDICDPKLPQQLLEHALARYGRCDILINNAGIITNGKIEDIDIDKVCSMVRVNVEAAFRTAYVFVRHFKAEDKGYLINISSIMGEKVRETVGAYAGTKWAIEALSEALRMELSKTNVRLSCIEPGLVKTELHRDWEVHPSELLNIPDVLTPDDIAREILHVLEQPAHVRIPKLMVLPKGHVI